MPVVAVLLTTATCGGGAGTSDGVTARSASSSVETSGEDRSQSNPVPGLLSSTLLGAPATVTYRFRAVAAGEATVSLRYARSWESVPAARTFQLNVRVHS